MEELSHAPASNPPTLPLAHLRLAGHSKRVGIFGTIPRVLGIWLGVGDFFTYLSEQEWGEYG